MSSSEDLKNDPYFKDMTKEEKAYALEEILNDEIDKEIKECIERGEINHTTGGAIIYGKLTKEEKEFWE